MTTGRNPLKDPMQQVWTIPNILSYLRIVVFMPLSLALIVSGYYAWSLVALFFLGCSDWLDGYLARRLNQRSRLGEELDPIADRASILLTSLTMDFTGILPWEVFALIAVVDVTLAGIALVLFKGYPNSQVNIFGKARTALLLVGLPMLLFAEALQSPGWRVAALVVGGGGVAIHWIAGATYVQQMVASWRSKRNEGESAR